MLRGTKTQEILLRLGILALIWVLAFVVRLFSVIRFESGMFRYHYAEHAEQSNLLAQLFTSSIHTSITDPPNI